MADDILTELNALGSTIDSGNYIPQARSCVEWGGADVIISSHMTAEIKAWLGDTPLVISLQESQPRRRAVVTPHAQELSWLFGELGKVFAYRIDFVSKYDFYGALAQSAIDFIEVHDSRTECIKLLKAVLDEAKRMASA